MHSQIYFFNPDNAKRYSLYYIRLALRLKVIQAELTKTTKSI